MIIKLEDIVYIKEKEFDTLGEIHKFTRRPYKVKEIRQTCVVELEGLSKIGCCLAFERFRKPNKRELTSKKYLKLKNHEYYTNQ